MSIDSRSPQANLIGRTNIVPSDNHSARLADAYLAQLQKPVPAKDPA